MFPRALAPGSLHGGQGESWCLLIHADAFLSRSLLPQNVMDDVARILQIFSGHLAGI